MINKLYPWLKLLLGGIVFILYDALHISHTAFIIVFVVVEIIILLLDILSRHKIKITPTTLGWYFLYNYMGIKIILMS